MKSTTFFHLIIGALCLLMSLLTIEYHPAGHAGPAGNYRYSFSGYGPNIPDGSFREIPVGISHDHATSRAQYLSSFAADKANERQDGAGAESAAFFYERDGALLSGEAGSMRRPSRLSINGISRGAAPEMGTGMVNVTAGHAAFRMLPHGMLFEKHIRIVLPYDTSLLPPGFSPYDILTYYYDEMQGRWISIARDSVDTVKGQVISRVDHFTDFVNAVIQTPEMPETHAYVPTTFADMKVADPLAGLRIMDAPLPNNNGTANIYYPIDVPGGRQGLQPDIVLTYNSGCGSTWLGEGWDIAVSAVTVETRWGVPRYEPELESEVYLLDGEQLATKDEDKRYNPLGHRALWVNRTGGPLQFYPRTERAFRKIIRHGDTPKNYWWEVRDKNGLIYYYGKKLGANEFDPEAVLCDYDGNIAKWGLSEIRDLHGNFVYYRYENVSKEFGGKAMYIKEISYTGHDTEEGRYRVTFERTSRTALGAPDVTVNYRYGFRETTDDLLNAVLVKYGEEIVKGYAFTYFINHNPSHSGKTLLNRVADIPQSIMDRSVSGILGFMNNPNNHTSYHNFEYHGNPIDFGPEVIINTGNDSEVKEKIMPLVKRRATSVGGTSSHGWGVGGAFTAGVGYNPSAKNVTAGGNYNYSESTTEGLLALIDLDGDGLPDKVFKNKDNDRLYYRKQYLNNGRYEFSSTRIMLNGLTKENFLRDKSSSHDFGFEGHLTFYGAGASVSTSRSKSKSSSNIYFSDVDGDGLPDIIQDGFVHYNRLNESGIPEFHLITTSKVMVGGSCDSSYIFQDQGVDERIFLPGDTMVTRQCFNVGDSDPQDNIIRNGRFDQNNSYIYSDYVYGERTYGLSANGTCRIVNYSTQVQPNLQPPLYDHTRGDRNGKYMMYNSAATQGKVLWRQDVQVEPGTFYNLQLWTSSIPYYHFELPLMEVYVNGNSLGTAYSTGENRPSWRKFNGTWYSGENTSARIEIRDRNNLQYVKDIALDDVHFAPCNNKGDSVVCRFDTVITRNNDEPLPDFDAVRVWIAPYDGEVDIEGTACLSENLMEARILTPAMDGAQVSIQHNGDIIRTTRLYPDEEGSCADLTIKRKIRKGDRLYFRLESLEKRLYDKINWSPKISYYILNGRPVGTVYPDANSNYPTIFDSKKDFLVNARRKYYMPFTGRVVIRSIFSMATTASDDIDVIIYRNGSRVRSQIIKSGITARNMDMSTTLNVNERDSIWFVVSSTSNVDWKAFDWEISYYYNSIQNPDVEAMNPYTDPPQPNIRADNINPQFYTYPMPVCESKPYVPLTEHRFQSLTVVLPGAVDGEPVFMTVKNYRNRLSARGTGTVSGGQVIIRFPSEVILERGITYHLDLNIDNRHSATGITMAYCAISGNIIPVGVYAQQDRGRAIFGEMYRNWGQFTYKKHPDDGDAINESRLFFDAAAVTNSPQNFDGIDTADTDGLEDQLAGLGFYDPMKGHFFMMEPDYPNRRWMGYANMTYVTADTISNTYCFQNEVDETEFPIPQTLTNEPVFAVKKQSRISGRSRNIGISAAVASYGWNWNSGESYLLSDFIDLNGDRYPDVMSEEGIQYSKPQGGLSQFTRGVFSPQKCIDYSEYNGRSSNFGASYSKVIKKIALSKKNVQMEVSGSAGVSGSTGNNQDETVYAWMDVNGDGLPDRVYKGNFIEYNTGYGFHAAVMEDMVTPKGTSGSAGGSAGSSGGLEVEPSCKEINLFETSIAGGLGLNGVENKSLVQYIDVNGDGLPDRLWEDGNGNTKADINAGTRFLPSRQLMALSPVYRTHSTTGSINGALSFGFTLSIFPIKFVINPQSTGNWSVNRTHAQFIDMNGDGLPDYVTSDDIGQVKVRYNLGGKTNLLSFIQHMNISGSDGGNMQKKQIYIDYELTENSYECPQRQWVMSSVECNGMTADLMAPSVKTHTTYTYQTPRYDRYDREHLGFETVTSVQHHEDTAQNRILTEKYHNTDYMRKGLRYSELLSAPDGKKYIEKLYHYRLKEIETGQRIPEGRAFCYGEGYPALDEEIVRYYEGSKTAFAIQTRKRYDHGPYGNIKVYYNDQDLADNSDDLIADITYFQDRSSLHLVGIPTEIKVKDRWGGTLRKRTATIDPATGKTTRMTVFTGSGNAVSDYIYDRYGNMEKITYPENHNGERAFSRYEYDTEVHTYPVATENVWGERSLAEYDFRWGNPVKTTDVNGHSITYAYDRRGRLLQVTSPYENDYTLRCFYSYDDPRWNRSMTNDYAAVTEHYDPQEPGNPMTTISITNGFGMSQMKKDAEINGREMLVVSGAVEYDRYLRPVKEYYPTEETLGPNNHKWNRAIDSQAPTSTTYDILDRTTSVRTPAGYMTGIAYQFGEDHARRKRFLTTTVDANGNIHKSYTDPRGLTVQSAAPMDAHTFFSYNALGELIESADPDGVKTYYDYDMAGRCIKREHSSSGVEVRDYDAAGNLYQRTTSGLMDRGSEPVYYSYEYNRLTGIQYPINPDMNVWYVYGSPGDGRNGAGRVVLREDGSGMEETVYGKMGEVTSNLRTFVVPFDDQSYSFRMHYTYDTWNRITRLTYPDGEEVVYRYDRGGNLKEMKGYGDSGENDYIRSIKYDKFGHRIEMGFGDGSISFYDYDVLLRLNRKYVRTSSGECLQDIAYDYDALDNITTIENSGGTLYGWLGGRYKYSFGYDYLNRMKSGEGSFTIDLAGSPSGESAGRTFTYRNELGYSKAGVIHHKQTHFTGYVEGEETLEDRTYDYGYKDDRPQLLRHVWSPEGERSYEWDANGNMTRIYHSGDGSRRFLFWDEQNRLKGFGQDDRVGHYRYDAHGERYFKWTGEAAWMNYNGRILRRMWFSSPTLYASPYLVATPQGYTKHYYAGMDRIASRIGGGGLIELGMEPWELDMKKQQVTEAAYRFYEEDLGLRDIDIVENLSVLYEYEGRVHDGNECYFYHTDQIGSSNWITNQDGQPVQHLQYLPFGEPWIDQRVSEWNSRYTFSGKERDAGTGLSYFGARYYDSGLSIWLSADPLMSKYPSLSPYTYCANNPVRYFDPDGRWIPGLDDNGNVTYTAEKGDNLYTFQKQFGVGGREALNIFKQSGLSTNDNVSFEAGEAVIGGSIVQEHTGNDVLKGQWYNLTNTQKASQIMFGMLYSKHHNQTADNGTYSMNINDFIDGFYVGSSGLDFNDVYIPAKGGGLIQIDHMSLAPSSTMGNPPLIYYRRFGGDENLRTDGSNFSSYHFFSAKNKDAKSPFKAMIISIPTGINNSKFRKSY